MSSLFSSETKQFIPHCEHTKESSNIPPHPRLNNKIIILKQIALDTSNNFFEDVSLPDIKLFSWLMT